MAKKKIVIVCDVCGGDRVAGAHDFMSFHYLMFCSPDCLEEYRMGDEERRVRKEMLKKSADKIARASAG